MTVEPWRKRCPKGHTTVVRVTAGPQSNRDEPAYVCESCEAEYNYIVDVKRDERQYAMRKPA